MKPTLISGMYPHPSGCSGAAAAGDPGKIIKDKVNINIVFGGCLSRPGDQNLSSPQEARRVYKGGMNTHSVQAMKEDQEPCLELGANGFITKPIDIENFREGIKEVLK